MAWQDVQEQHKHFWTASDSGSCPRVILNTLWLIDECWKLCQGQWLLEVSELHLQCSLGWSPSKTWWPALCSSSSMCRGHRGARSHKHCVQIWVLPAAEGQGHPSCVWWIFWDTRSCITPPAPLQPQAQPAIKIINEHASKVYPSCLFLCVFQSVCISSGTEVLCQLSSIAEVCVCWWSMAVITIQLKMFENLVPCRCRVPLTSS